mgnify:CR=1 FL=1|jgi:uncharacterized protein YceK
MKKLIFPLLLILAIVLTGCGSDSSKEKAELEAARQRNKEFMHGTNDNADHSWRNKKLKKDLTDSGKPHQFSK